MIYSKTCLKRPLKKKTKISFQDQFSLNAGQKYCRMLPRMLLEHSAILSTFIKLPFVNKIFVLSIFEGPLKTGFTVILYWTKVETLHLNCLPFIYKIKQASKANENVSECSKTVLCITVKVLRMLIQVKTWKPFKCDSGPIFQVTNLDRNLTLFSRPSEIQYQRSLIAQNGSLGMQKSERSRNYHKCVLIV